MAGVRRLDLRRHPPPDLALEIDVTHSSLDQMEIHAALNVPELWRLEGDELTFYVLGPEGRYVSAAESRSFAGITPVDLLPFLREARDAGDQTPVLDRSVAWVRTRRSGQPKRRRGE